MSKVRQKELKVLEWRVAQGGEIGEIEERSGNGAIAEVDAIEEPNVSDSELSSP